MSSTLVVDDVASSSLPSPIMRGGAGFSTSFGLLDSLIALALTLALAGSPKMESPSSVKEEALLARAGSDSLAARLSFSRRVSRPRLWQYQKTKRRTASMSMRVQ
jgi:hypothetical protein